MLVSLSRKAKQITFLKPDPDPGQSTGIRRCAELSVCSANEPTVLLLCLSLEHFCLCSYFAPLTELTTRVSGVSEWLAFNSNQEAFWVPRWTGRPVSPTKTCGVPGAYCPVQDRKKRLWLNLRFIVYIFNTIYWLPTHGLLICSLFYVLQTVVVLDFPRTNVLTIVETFGRFVGVCALKRHLLDRFPAFSCVSFRSGTWRCCWPSVISQIAEWVLWICIFLMNFPFRDGHVRGRIASHQVFWIPVSLNGFYFSVYVCL